MDLDALMLDPIYDTLGVEVEIDIGESEPVTLLVIDKTAGVEVSPTGEVNSYSVLPVMACKAVDLIDLDLKPGDLVKRQVTLNGVTWRIENHLPKPGIKGELAGQVYFRMRKP